MSEASSRIVKRKRKTQTFERSLRSTKVRSCDACRRLKTRCEIGYGSDKCHRCNILRLDCSFQGSICKPQPSIQMESSSEGEKYKDLQNRISAIEMSLTEVKTLLSSQSADGSRKEPHVNPSSNSPAKQIHLAPGASSVSVERTTRDAPMSLIQEIKENIALPEEASQIESLSEDVITNGIVSEDVAQVLLEGFTRLSSRWLFMSTDPAELRTKSSLLFGTCILAGIHITPSLYGSETHQKLYNHVQGILARSQLVSGASLDTIQALLIFSMWDLRPTRDHDHGNSWLLSGIAAMQVVMTTRFETLFRTNDCHEVSRSREILRTWNLVCLCHLQFSISCGRPPVISGQYLHECSNILKFQFYNSRDELVLAGVELYRTLWELITSEDIQIDGTSWPEIEKLQEKHEHIYNLDSSEPLRFAYSCTNLILARRTLRQISYLQNKEKGESNPSYWEKSRIEFIQFAIHHSHQILSLFLSMSDLTTYVHPAYENLLCSFAMLTLVELADHVPNVFEAVTLMEQSVSHIQRGGKAEPVGRWSLSIMKQYITGSNDPDSTSCERESIENELQLFDPATDIMKSWEEVDWGFEQEFPSLQEMFFGNMP